MPQPPEVSASPDPLIQLYRDARDRLVAQLQAVVDDPARTSQVARLRTLIANVRSELADLDTSTRQWLTDDLPVLHEAGATAGADVAGSSFTWTQGHREAVQALAGQTWETIGAGLQDVSSQTIRALRDLVSEAASGAIVEGKTAVQAGTDLAKAAAQQGIASVTYANGSQYPIDAWAETVMRTTTAQAYNSGTFQQAREDGFDFMLCTDGEDCGLDGHDDPDLADGTIRSIDVAEEFPISHPNCARSWAPAADVGSPAEARALNEASQPDREAAAVVERGRAERATTTLSGHARAARTPRTART